MSDSSSLIFRCLVCEAAPTFLSFPLCLTCRDALVPCPKLCGQCGIFSCERSENQPLCRPWNQPKLESLASGYLLLGRAFSVLKKWKWAHGPLFDRIVLKIDNQMIESWRKKKIDFMVPIPGNPKRSWERGGCPVQKITRFLSVRAGVPVIHALSRTRENERAALQNRVDRFFRKNPFKLSANITGKNILIVDDFITTGSTLLSATEVLREGKPSTVHGFSLGLRPQLNSFETTAT